MVYLSLLEFSLAIDDVMAIVNLCYDGFVVIALILGFPHPTAFVISFSLDTTDGRSTKCMGPVISSKLDKSTRSSESLDIFKKRIKRVNFASLLDKTYFPILAHVHISHILLHY